MDKEPEPLPFLVYGSRACSPVHPGMEACYPVWLGMWAGCNFWTSGNFSGARRVQSASTDPRQPQICFDIQFKVWIAHLLCQSQSVLRSASTGSLQSLVSSSSGSTLQVGSATNLLLTSSALASGFTGPSGSTLFRPHPACATDFRDTSCALSLHPFGSVRLCLPSCSGAWCLFASVRLSPPAPSLHLGCSSPRFRPGLLKLQGFLVFPSPQLRLGLQFSGLHRWLSDR